MSSRGIFLLMLASCVCFRESKAVEVHLGQTTRRELRIQLTSADDGEYMVQWSYDLKDWGNEVSVSAVNGRAEWVFPANSISKTKEFFRVQKVGHPPVIQTQPRGTNVTATSVQVSMSTFATGSPPLTYQWFKNSQPIAGATGSSITFMATPANWGDNYYVTVSNPYGKASSWLAGILVNAPPPPFDPPASVAGKVVDISISSGSGPFASFGAYDLLTVGSTYASVWPNGANIGTTGTYAYAVTGSKTATMVLNDVRLGSGIVVTLGFNSADSGVFSLYQASTGGTQAGTFSIR